MFLRHCIAGGLLAALPAFAWAADADIAALRAEIEALRSQYEARIAALEAKLAQAERERASVGAQPSPSNTATAFNPAISLILSGTYANLQRDPASCRLDGFVPSGGEVGPPPRSFSLGESELVLAANIDPYLRGEFMLAAAPDNSIAVENAYLQTLALPKGFTLKAGRFYSGIGYINEQHAHAWDFVDAPLAQQAFLGGQYAQDGVQLKWLAPTETFLELGAEVGRGQNFPGAERNKNGVGAWSLGARIGGDVGVSHAWLAGLSYLQTRPRDRQFQTDDASGNLVTNTFAGRSNLWLASLVWKWAPAGNPSVRHFKFQSEYYRAGSEGSLTYDLGGSNEFTDGFRSVQSGWYAQGVYQFMPRWRVGLRYDRLHAGTLDAGANTGQLPLLAAYDPHRASMMVDYSPSEYSRFRLQFSRDAARRDVTDNQVFLQYVLSLGAHGAHAF
ncbi:TonB-dependent receptor [Thiobacter aerophilum]|uniref:TonB-dependent receptor n=1 Tax=Thiobacter aerophilum TaxID=3121275 RepID=A0ABV0EH83_9BURK